MSVALLSAYDKRGLLEFARGLSELGWNLVSSGGTADVLRSASIAVVSVEELTGLSSMLGGRVKTLHPTIHAGILARRDVPEDMAALERGRITPIDLVAVDLYPFEKAARDPALDEDAVVEMIDVGGPAMLRAAAKNWRHVVVVPGPELYAPVLDALRAGGVGHEMRRHLASETFALLSRYDSRVARFLTREEFPPILSLSYERGEALRYGENPHQPAAVYSREGYVGPSVTGARALSGKTLSYNNLVDMDVAMCVAASFHAPTAAVVKHASPCGIASSGALAAAMVDAYECDPVSAYGCVIAVNREIDLDTARFIHDMPFVEAVAAPSFAEESLELMRRKSTRRLVAVGPLDGLDPLTYKGVAGGMLVQKRDLAPFDRASCRVATKRAPTEREWAAMEFAFAAVRWVASNAIVLVSGTKTVGIGGGQPNRVDSVRIAVDRAGDKTRGSVLGSDAMFPFADGVETAARAGVAAIVQPGGSKRDAEVIAAADAAGIAMVFTGIRTFRH